MGGDCIPTIEELAGLVEARVEEQLPATRLRAAIALSRELTDSSDALIGHFVAEARAAGMSWTEIGQLFGTSRQAAQQRYGATIDEPGRWPGRWTPAAREALDRAGAEARALSHDYLGTEHVLLALATAEGGVAAAVLRELGVARDRLLSTSCMQAGTGAGDPHPRLPVMPRLKQALEHSLRVADGLGESLADTEHLLAGIVAIPDSMAVEILRRLRVSVADVRAALAGRLQVEPERLGTPRRRRRRLRASAR